MGQQIVAYSSAARTATPTVYSFNARNFTSARIIVDATAVTSTPSVVFTLETQDVTTGKWFTLLTSSAIATVSANVLTLVSGLAGMCRITATHGNANSITYSCTVHLAR